MPDQVDKYSSYTGGARVIHINDAPKIAVEYIGDGPLVIFLHGIGGDRSTWSYQLSHFAQSGFCAAAWDTRGYGDSDDYDGPLSFTDIANDLEKVISAFAVNKAHIIGTSMGGRIALEFYAHYPHRFATMILAGVHTRFKSFSAVAQRQFVESRSKPLIQDGLKPAELAPRVIGKLVGPQATNEAKNHGIAAMSRLHTNSYLKTVEATTTFDREHVLQEITVPTLVIGGEFDPLTPPNVTKAIAEKVKQAEYHLMFDVGHLSNLEHPVEFNRVAGQFVERYRNQANLAADPRIIAC